MECVVVSLVLIACFVALTFALLASAGRGQWTEAFKHVARRFHGTLHSGGWFQSPCVWLRHGEAQARLTISRLRGSEDCYLEFTIQQRAVAGHCEIFYDQTRESLLPRRRGLLSLELNGSDFYRRWHVLAEDAEATRELLSDGVRLAIELLWRQPIPAETTISLSPDWLVVRKVWSSARGQDVEAFVERALALSDQINLSLASDIEFVAGEQPQLLENARCGVCGQSLASEIVVCRRCNTPHHLDCWQYNSGGCATYGCGGRECIVPAVALPANQSNQPRP